MNSFKTKSIKKEGLGEKLFAARQSKNISIKQASASCKIPENFLLAIESERWKDLPGEVYLKGFLKKYCTFLRLNFGLCFEQYKKQVYQEALRKKEDNKKNKWQKFISCITPYNIKIAIFAVVFMSLLGYIYYETNRYMRPPRLDIFYPEKNYSTTENMILIKGKTDSEANVSVNGEMLAIEEDGAFSVEAKLKYGLNKFEIISQRKHGRQHKEDVVVFKKEN